MDKYTFLSDAAANPGSTVTGPNYRFTIIDDIVLRYEWSEDGVFEDRASTFAINRNFAKPKFRIEDEESQLQIFGPAFHLTYDRKRFSPNGFLVSFTSKLMDMLSEWRYGDAPLLNLGGTARTLDEVDGRLDMGTGVLSRAGFAALDDSQSMLFDGHGFVTPRRPGDRVDGYLFCCAHNYRETMRSFYAISGRQPVVPRWCLGNWWSRYHAYTATEYLDLMDNFKAHDIPLSVAVIDMDWHIVKGDEVPHAGWTGYTWNKALFPDPDSFMQSLHEKRLKTSLNDHPHSGVHCHEDIYEEMAEVLGHDTTNRKPILFEPTSPTFMHAYLNVLHRHLEGRGCDFWWIDWQQGLNSRVPGVDPLWMLNHFQFLDAEQHTSRGRPIIFSRYAGPGSHRYPVGFSGDTIVTWDSLEFQPEFTATASNIGYGWWSHDLGGHTWGYRDDELTVRWIQFGAFSPILRLHSCDSRWMSKEPWRYRPDSEVALQSILQLRHRLVPYIFSTNVAGFESDTPLIQPMYWSFPSRDAAYEVPNQYYFGSALVVAPIVRPRDKRTNRAHTKVWIPPQRHVDIFTGFIYDGDREVDMYRSLHQIPVLAPEGSIVPLDKELVPANGCANPESFEVLVIVGQDGQFTIREDTRDDNRTQATEENHSRSIAIKFDQTSGRLETVAAGRAWTFRFIAMLSTPSPIQVLINGSVSADANIYVETLPDFPSTKIELPATLDEESSIVIELGSNPQLAVLDYTATVCDLIEDSQIEIITKNRIWEIIQATQSATVKVGRILSLGLDKELAGPFVEMILSDSRTE